MKKCKNLACVKWDTLGEIKHALNSDLTVINGLELTVRQVGVGSLNIEAIEPIIVALNKLRWRIQDRVQQITDIITENS